MVKLADSESFQLKELWRDAADFVTLAGDHHMGLKLMRESGSDGDISVYFGKGVTQEEQVIFANYRPPANRRNASVITSARSVTRRKATRRC